MPQNVVATRRSGSARPCRRFIDGGGGSKVSSQQHDEAGGEDKRRDPHVLPEGFVNGQSGRSQRQSAINATKIIAAPFFITAPIL
jgi:hypothetical protein